MLQPTPEPKPFDSCSGPRTARIVLVGEAWGEQEELVGLPFIGASGQELTRMLRDAGLDRSACFITNTLNLRPPGNNLDLLCCSKKELPADYKLANLKQGKYLRPEFVPELARLKAEIEAVKPNLVVAFGNTACWALLGSAAIGNLRGAVSESTLCPGVKVLPTYHPVAVLRNWTYRVIVIADLMKAKREAEFPQIVRPECFITISPTLEEINDWVKRPFEALAVDIETTHGQISCIGFARSKSEALVIPFIDWEKPDRSYWPTVDSEITAWCYVRELLRSPAPKIFQNGLYDLQYIWRAGIAPVNVIADTMLLHHSLYPELQKGLGFLGSIYTNHSKWKLMRHEEVNKKDE